MKQISSVLIAGTGAIGSMIAYQVFKNNPASLSILAAGERLERYRTKGFVINGEPCFFPTTDARSTSSPDLVVIACKFHHLETVLADLQNHVNPETIIISLLNGISSEHRISEEFEKKDIPYSMILGTDAGLQGNCTTFSKTGTIYFGDAQNSANKELWSETVKSIASFFDICDIHYTVSENMLNRLWFKYMMNVALNQITAILRRPYRIFKKETLIPEAAELLEAAMREVIVIAGKEGITLTEEDIQTVYRTIDTISDEGKTSMLQDVEAKRKTEVEMFSGTLLELGKKHGIELPVNTLLFRMLKAIETSY